MNIIVSITPHEDGVRCGECKLDCPNGWMFTRETGRIATTRNGIGFRETERIRCAPCLAAEARLRALVEAARLKRCSVISDEKGFAGQWVAVPDEDFSALRAALAALEEK